MSDPDRSQDGPPSGVPTWLVVVMSVVAVGAVSALLVLLFNKTEGPAPTLRTFAERMRDGDCEGSYEMLDASVKGTTPQEAWCALLPSLEDRLDPGFRVQQMLFRDAIAELTVRGRLGTEKEVWRLRKVDREWRVLGPQGGFELPPP